jgi:hypothetical protein
MEKHPQQPCRNGRERGSTKDKYLTGNYSSLYCIVPQLGNRVSAQGLGVSPTPQGPVFFLARGSYALMYALG